MRVKSVHIIMVISFLFMLVNTSVSQDKEVRKSLQASVSQTIGTETVVTFNYSRPGVKGRTIFGDLVPFGLFEGNKYSEEKPFPWRIGANENTTIEVSTDVLVSGKKLAAGKYGMHAIPGKDEWTLIFSKDNDLWGSYKYNEANDALRLNIKPVETSDTEWLTFGFENLDGSSATAFFEWEKTKVPFEIKVSD